MEPFIIDVAATEDSDFVLPSHEGEEFIIGHGRYHGNKLRRKNTYLLEDG